MRIEAVGPGVTGLAEGDLVAALGYRSYAEADVVPAAMVVTLPPELEGQPFPGEALGCAFNIFRRSEIPAGQHVAIIGIGFLGAVLTRLASEAGATVIAISRRQESLELARNYGAAETIVMDDHWRIIEDVKAVTGETLCERVIECVGKQWPLDLAGELVGFGGRLVIAGYHQDGPRQVNMQGWNWKGIDVVNAHERDSERAPCRAGHRGARTGPCGVLPEAFGAKQRGGARRDRRRRGCPPAAGGRLLLPPYRHTAATALAELVRSGALGEIFVADLVFHNAYGADKPWFYAKAQSGGGG